MLLVTRNCVTRITLVTEKRTLLFFMNTFSSLTHTRIAIFVREIHNLYTTISIILIELNHLIYSNAVAFIVLLFF